MNGWICILIIVIIIVIAITLWYYKSTAKPEITGGAESKFETSIRDIFYKITGKKFEQAHPSWLKYKGKSLELDGYNAELGLAFEVQGPQHTRYDKKYDSNYSDYYNRLLNDKAKSLLCKDHGVSLIIIDYSLPKVHLTNYIKSRIYDICNDAIGSVASGNANKSVNVLSRLVCNNSAFITKPTQYMLEKDQTVYRNKIYETELDLHGLDEMKIAKK